jgi:hypothetical protein
MSFVVRKLPLAEQDALEAAIWYEAREPGLGDEFLTEVDRAVRTLSESALFYRIRFADVRRAPIQVLRRLLCRPRRRGLDIGDFSWAASSASAARRTQRDDVSAHQRGHNRQHARRVCYPGKVRFGWQPKPTGSPRRIRPVADWQPVLPSHF